VFFPYEQVYLSQDFFLKLSTAGPEQIHFTMDGSIPDSSSDLYEHPIRIGKTTVIRARVLGAYILGGPVISKTFLFELVSQPPTFCLTTAPENLWDEEVGIYVLGKDYVPNRPYFVINFWQDWVRPVHIELWEPDVTIGFETDAGMKIFGAWIRARSQNRWLCLPEKNTVRNTLITRFSPTYLSTVTIPLFCAIASMTGAHYVCRCNDANFSRRFRP